MDLSWVELLLNRQYGSWATVLPDCLRETVDTLLLLSYMLMDTSSEG